MCVCVCVYVLYMWIGYRGSKKPNGIVEREPERKVHMLERIEFGITIRNRES